MGNSIFLLRFCTRKRSETCINVIINITQTNLDLGTSGVVSERISFVVQWMSLRL